MIAARKQKPKPKVVVTSLRELCRAGLDDGRSVDDAVAWAKIYLAARPTLRESLFGQMETDTIRQECYAVMRKDREVSRPEWIKKGIGIAPPTTAPQRNPVTSLGPAARAREQSMLETYRLADGRCLGDLCRVDVAALAERMQATADRYGRDACFFRAILQRLPEGQRVRDAFAPGVVEQLYAAAEASIPAAVAACENDGAAPNPG